MLHLHSFWRVFVLGNMPDTAKIRRFAEDTGTDRTRNTMTCTSVLCPRNIDLHSRAIFHVTSASHYFDRHATLVGRGRPECTAAAVEDDNWLVYSRNSHNNNLSFKLYMIRNCNKL